MASAKECRANAARCVKRGNDAATVERQNLYFEMARSWIEMAEQLERYGALQRQLRNAPATSPARACGSSADIPAAK